jgi:hypothetical protein
MLVHSSYPSFCYPEIHLSHRHESQPPNASYPSFCYPEIHLSQRHESQRQLSQFL